MIKQILKVILPKTLVIKLSFLKFLFVLIPEYMLDMFKYWKYSASIKLDFITNKKKIQGRIIVLYHAIEKGLSIPGKTRVFGIEKRNNLIELMNIYEEKFGIDGLYKYCIIVLKKHEEWIRNNYPEIQNFKSISHSNSNTSHYENIKGGLRKVSVNKKRLNDFDYDF